MELTVQTLHPDGKKGVNISKVKYDTLRAGIVKHLLSGKEMTYTDLLKALTQELGGNFDGSVAWYLELVKLDLEARKVIQRVPNTKPTRLRLVGK